MRSSRDRFWRPGRAHRSPPPRPKKAKGAAPKPAASEPAPSKPAASKGAAAKPAASKKAKGAASKQGFVTTVVTKPKLTTKQNRYLNLPAGAKDKARQLAEERAGEVQEDAVSPAVLAAIVEETGGDAIPGACYLAELPDFTCTMSGEDECLRTCLGNDGEPIPIDTH